MARRVGRSRSSMHRPRPAIIFGRATKARLRPEHWIGCLMDDIAAGQQHQFAAALDIRHPGAGMSARVGRRT